MLAYHIFFVGTAIGIFFIFTILYSGKDEYEEINSEIYKRFNMDLTYTLDIIQELTPREADFKIDEFEERWHGIVSNGQLKQAIGRLIQATFEVGI